MASTVNEFHFIQLFPSRCASECACSAFQCSSLAQRAKLSSLCKPLHMKMKFLDTSAQPNYSYDFSYTMLRQRLGYDPDMTCKGHAAPVTEAEKEGWDKRQREAGQGQLNNGSSWEWSLNWDEITPSIIVGSCPRSADDVDKIIEGTGANAILNLQSDLCFDALKIPIDSIKRRASERGVYLERVAIRDFDHGDQALMLPEAVRMLNLLVARGLKTYVHCTAGINRATLTVVGYLTFLQGMDLDEAVKMVRAARSVAHPYIDCWTEVKRRLLEGRLEELTGVSRHIYEARCHKGMSGSSRLDWEAAQKQVITSTFRRWLDVDLGMIQTELELLDRQYAAALRKVKAEFENEIQVKVEDKEQEEEEEEKEEDDEALECDVETRQCVSPKTKT